MNDQPWLSLVVSTIGRPSALLRLVHSLAYQQPDSQAFELVVVDQSPDGNCIALLEQLEPPLRWTASRSDPGVSLGRNTGADLASGTVLGFPDDDCWYPPTAVARVGELTGEAGQATIISGRQLTGDGQPSMLRWPDEPRLLNRHDVWRAAISSTIFLSRAAFDALDGFNEELGVGAHTPWQAGEDTDLLLRAMAGGLQVRYDPSLVIHQDDPRRKPGADMSFKMRGYGEGIGRVMALNRYPRSYLTWLVSRKAVVSGTRLVGGRLRAAEADLAWARGVWHGYHQRATA